MSILCPYSSVYVWNRSSKSQNCYLFGVILTANFTEMCIFLSIRLYNQIQTLLQAVAIFGMHIVRIFPTLCIFVAPSLDVVNVSCSLPFIAAVKNSKVHILTTVIIVYCLLTNTINTATQNIIHDRLYMVCIHESEHEFNVLIPWYIVKSKHCNDAITWYTILNDCTILHPSFVHAWCRIVQQHPLY